MGGPLRGSTWAGLSSQVTHESGVQGLFQDIRPMELGHVERGRGGGGVAGRRVALAGDGGGRHVEGGGALLVELALAVLVQRQRQALPLLPAIAEPDAHHLGRDSAVSRSPTATLRSPGPPSTRTYVSLQAQVV